MRRFLKAKATAMEHELSEALTSCHDNSPVSDCIMHDGMNDVTKTRPSTVESQLSVLCGGQGDNRASFDGSCHGDLQANKSPPISDSNTCDELLDEEEGTPL